MSYASEGNFTVYLLEAYPSDVVVMYVGLSVGDIPLV